MFEWLDPINAILRQDVSGALSKLGTLSSLQIHLNVKQGSLMPQHYTKLVARLICLLLARKWAAISITNFPPLLTLRIVMHHRSKLSL